LTKNNLFDKLIVSRKDNLLGNPKKKEKIMKLANITLSGVSLAHVEQNYLGQFLGP